MRAMALPSSSGGQEHETEMVGVDRSDTVDVAGLRHLMDLSRRGAIQ